jgi:hypothetical protein
MLFTVVDIVHERIYTAAIPGGNDSQTITAEMLYAYLQDSGFLHGLIGDGFKFLGVGIDIAKLYGFDIAAV